MRSLSLQHIMLRYLSVATALFAFAACAGDDSSWTPRTNPRPLPTEPSAVSPVPQENLPGVILPQTIAWTSLRTGWKELYKMDPLGAQSTQLTTLKTVLQGVSWSWDNKRLATIRYRAVDVFHGHNDIWIINADGSNGHWARAQPSAWDFYDPSWSPDGSRIVMTVHVGGTTKVLGWLELATSKAGLFYLPGGGGVKGWKPSYNKAGTKILYSTGLHPGPDQSRRLRPPGPGQPGRLGRPRALLTRWKEDRVSERYCSGQRRHLCQELQHRYHQPVDLERGLGRLPELVARRDQGRFHEQSVGKVSGLHHELGDRRKCGADHPDQRGRVWSRVGALARTGGTAFGARAPRAGSSA